MNRTSYFNYIEDKLGTLAYRIGVKGKLNVLDLNNHSENFYCYLLNKLFDLDFQNANAFKQNVEAIDLIDHTNKCICQISATNTKEKVENALSKDIIGKYPDYTFKFISIAKECSDLRTKTFSNPHSITFNPITDIIDNKSILDTAFSANIAKQKEIFEFIKSELGNDPIDVVKLDTNLAIIINILAKDDFSSTSQLTVNSFEIDRKIEFNNLINTKQIIEEFASYYQRVDNQYTEFDAQGSNKSTFVLQSINKSYVEETVKNTHLDDDNIFLKVIENIIDKVLKSANYVSTPLDELEFCVSALVVNAFIRCKIFKNPLDYNYATT